MGGSAWADPTTIYFTGTTGVCRTLPCDELDVGVLPGRPFTGHFTYDAFTPTPNDWGGFAGEVENFVVEFENVSFTANQAELRIQPFDGRRQFVAVLGEIPGGFMTLGVVSTELPARTDLLNAAGITWDCMQWGLCGMQIRVHEAPFTENTLQYPTGSLPFTLPWMGVTARFSSWRLRLPYVPQERMWPMARRRPQGNNAAYSSRNSSPIRRSGAFVYPRPNDRLTASSLLWSAGR